MKGGKWKHEFIKDHISGDIDVTFRNIETLKTLMHVAIPKEYTMCGPKLKLIGVVGA
jgi:hypothetical protein